MENIKIYYGFEKIIKKEDKIKKMPSVAIVNEKDKTSFIFTKDGKNINLKIRYEGQVNKSNKERMVKITHEHLDKFYNTVFSFIVEDLYYKWEKTGNCKTLFDSYNDIASTKDEKLPSPISNDGNKILIVDEKNKANKIKISFPFIPYTDQFTEYGIKNIMFYIPNKKEVNFSFGTEESPYAYCGYTTTFLPKFLVNLAKLPESERLTPNQFSKAFNLENPVNA